MAPDKPEKPAPETVADTKPDPQAPETGTDSAAGPEEIGGPQGAEPTRFGDWERNGRCSDF